MSYDSVVTADSPLYWWKLAETSGTSASDSADSNTGTYQGTVTLGQTGIPGSTATAALLNGTTGWVTTTTSAAAPNTFSVEIWFKTTAAVIQGLAEYNGSQTVANNTQQDRILFVDAAGKVNWAPGGNATGMITSASAYNDGNWHHAVATFTSAGSASVLYVDGVQVGTTSTPVNAYTGFWRVGEVYWSVAGLAEFFSGTIAHAAIYSVVLTGTQVTSHYNAGITAPSAPTVTTNAASNITATSATLNGTVNPNGNDATVHFEYGTTTGYGTSTANQDAGAGSSNVPMSVGITGLVVGTTYHFRVVAVNAGGTTNGADQTFIATAVAFTLPPPTKAQWTFVLCDASGNPLAELSTASSRSISLKRNSYTEVQLTLSHEDDAASLLLSALMNTGVPKLKGYRRGVNDNSSVAAPLRFRGPLMGLQEQSDENSILTCTFRSPFGVLIGDGDKAGRFYQGATPLIYTATDAGLIAKALIDLANADATTGLGTGANLVTATKLRDRTYPTGQNIGAAVMDLTAVLDGFDFYETFSDGPSVTLTTPALAGSFSTLNSWTGANNFFGYRITAFSGTGETLASNEVVLGSFINGVAGVAALSWAPVPGASGYNIYRAPATGGVGTGESTSPAFLASVGASVTSYVDTGATVSAGAVPSTGGAIGVDAFFNVVQSQGIVNPNARFEYGPKTIANVWSVDRTTTPPVNCVIITGGNGLISTYSDATSVAKYGKWWGRADFSTIIEQATLDDKAKGLVRPKPVKTVKIVPDLALSPLPFDDWNLGDTVPFFASRSALTENTQLRINGFTIPISDDGQETIEVNDSSSPEEDAVIRASLIAEVVA